MPNRGPAGSTFGLPTLGEATARPLIFDIGGDAIRVLDGTTKELIATDRLAQVTATPTAYIYKAESAGWDTSYYKHPVLVVDFPGWEPVRIGARPSGAGHKGIPQFRYTWRGRVRTSGRGSWAPVYVVTEAEWPTLLQNFGLGDRVVDDLASGKMERPEWDRVKRYVSFSAVPVVVFGVAIYHHFAR
jgi:hypothetical protein